MKNTLKIGLLEAEIEEIVRIIRQNERIEKLILFGSRAKGTFQAGSDIDLAVSGNSLSTSDILDLSIEIENIGMPYKFDLVILERIKQRELLDHINRVGIVLYEK